MPTSHSRFALPMLVALLAEACGGGGGGGINTPPPPPPAPPPPPPALVLAKGSPSGDNQTAVAGQQLSAPLRVRATRGTAVAPGEAVSWSTSSGQIVGNGPTGADGVASAVWTLGAGAGSRTATATSGGASVQFSATATTPPQGTFAIVLGAPSGNGQTVPLGTLLPDPLRVVVTQNGQPAGGALVIWETTASNGFFDPPQSITGLDGTATATWNLGTTVGIQNASATVGQAGGPSVAFTATATAISGGGTVEIHLTTSGGARFVPANVVVAPGTTVRWIWDDGPHTVTASTAGSFPGNPSADNPPKTYEFTFTQAGTFGYYCTVHGTRTTGMRGTVVVQ